MTSWNSAQQYVIAQIPPNRPLFEGIAAPQTGALVGSQLPEDLTRYWLGGGNQIFLSGVEQGWVSDPIPMGTPPPGL